MAEICQKVLDGLGMQAELALSIVVQIHKVIYETIVAIEL